MSKAPWTEISEEVKNYFAENPGIKCEIDYIEAENKKRWTFTTADKKKVVFEQFFDMNFFK